MRQRAIKIGLTTLILTAAFSGLMYSTLRDETQYYKHVDEVMADPGAWHGKRLQLHGYVAGLERRRDSLDYRFNVENAGAVIPATYTGIVPDTFKNGSEVVVKGQLGPDGFVVEKDGVMAKCPSKYEPGPGTK
jgi:cytochrome c-type biogenesis protein CcmE